MSVADRTAPATASPRARVLEKVVERVLLGVTVLFGALVALGILRTFGSLLGNSHPWMGWGYWSFNDAVEIFHGKQIYEDPADGYVGLLYPPVFTELVAALLHVDMWSGWGVVVSLLSGVALAAMAGTVAYRRESFARAKGLRIAEAGAIGMVGFWLCAGIPVLVMYDSRPDTLSWALAAGGVLLMPRALRAGQTKALVAAVLLLTAAFWTKQPAIAAAGAAGAWAVIAAWGGIVTWRRALAFLGAMAVVNVGILGLLDLITDGWSRFYLLELGRRHQWGIYPWDFIAERTVRTLWPATLFAVAALIAGGAAYVSGRGDDEDAARADAAPSTARPRFRALGGDPELQRLAVLALFLVVVLPLETYFQRKQGAESEHLLGIAWAIVLLGAAGYRWAGRLAITRIAVGAAVSLLLLVGLVKGTTAETGYGHVPKVSDHHLYSPVPADVVAYHEQGKTMLTQWGDMNTTKGMPSTNYIQTCELQAAAVAAPALERALLNRTYDMVVQFPLTDGTYCSGWGQYEDNYFWKLDQLMEKGYKYVPGAGPGGLMERKPGAQPALDALRPCFAPYALAGTLFRIGDGGGFWCQGAGARRQTMTLRQTPHPYSELVTDGVITSISGTLTLTLPRGVGGITVKAARPGGETTLISGIQGAPGARAARSITLRFAPSDGKDPFTIDPRRAVGARLLLAASTDSHARYDFSALRISAEDGLAVGRAADRR